MFEYADSPPSLRHSPTPSDLSQGHSRDSTPITPISATLPGRKDSSVPWFKKPIDVGRTTTRLCLETHVIEPDFDDDSYPQFGASPPEHSMAGAAGPITISPSQTSTSPRGNQPSTLTSALQKHPSHDKPTVDGMSMDPIRPTPQYTQNHMADNYMPEGGARPISVKGRHNNDKMRRESLAQSLGTGMSWGGVSVNSWIRDDMMMAGTSPFAFQSPSYHSSSYLPKLEANFMKDFSCCGLTLPTLHDLLQHYEEAHAQKDPVALDSAQPNVPDTRAALAANTANQVQQEAQQRSMQGQQYNAPVQSNLAQMPQRSGLSNTLQTVPDMDTVEDMEMDMDDGNDATPPPNLYTRSSATTSPSAPFATMQQPQIPQLNTTMMQGHQQYRQSAPSTPVATSRGPAFNNAPLSANPMQQFQDLQNPYRHTPDSSAPGTPGELDESLMAGMDDMSMQNPLFGTDAFGGNFGYGMNNDMIDLCIDEPAKRLFQQNGRPTQQQNGASVHSRLGSGQYGANSDIARTIRERQVAAGLPDTTTNIAPHEEPKPFRCPVIGCEKAYKNQNGLKYHKSHGHNNQRLHENGDGTFSIVNPDTQAPYPGTQGMEKEKPYKCDVCQKRYKNLNGLKYHKTHSPPCNPELQANVPRSPSMGMSGGMASTQNMGNMGAGLQQDHQMM